MIAMATTNAALGQDWANILCLVATVSPIRTLKLNNFNPLEELCLASETRNFKWVKIITNICLIWNQTFANISSPITDLLG